MDEQPRRIARSPDGRVAVRLAPRERQILGALADALAREATGGEQPSHTHDDPGLARLWPDAVTGDAEASAAFRDLTAMDLADVRRARFETLRGTLNAASLSDDEAKAWLGVVNDLRLVHGTRLGVSEDTGSQPVDESDPDAGQTIIFLWLGWVEEQLIEAVSATLPDVEGEG